MLSKTVASAECVWCGDRTYLYSPKLNASICGLVCEKRVSDRIYQELITAEEAQPVGQPQPRQRPEVATLGKRSFSIS